MEPDEIREIRTALGLTQSEAGILLGGGPSAFAKYEAGTIKPSAGLVKLLRLLDRNPSMLSSIPGAERRSNPPLDDTPFTATGYDVMCLREWELPQFFRALLHAEAQANGLPADDIHVAEEYRAADGGEDAHIRWEDGPSRTDYLPCRYTQFQIKSGELTAAKAGKEVLTKDGNIKPMVRTALEAGAHYVLLCTSSLTSQKARSIARKLCDSIRANGLPIDPSRIQVRDADQVAAWLSHYPANVVKLKERTRPNSIGPFRSWDQWASREEHILSPLVDDARFPALHARLMRDLVQPGAFVRVLGAAGVGKSRLVLECLCSRDAKGFPTADFVLYADQSEVEQTAICGAVRMLVDTGASAIVVVDDCPQETHQRLVGMVTAPSSRLLLVTIDNREEYSASAYDDSVVHIDQAPSEVTESIIDRELPTLDSEDRRRLLLFSRGFPTIAVRVANAWAENKPVPYSTDMYFAEAFVTGRGGLEPTLAIQTAMLIAAFGTVRHSSADSQISELANWGRQITVDDMHALLERLLDRGVVQRRGGLVVLQPRPVAMRLTERQWREWSPQNWITILTGDMSPHLRRNAAGQLAWINETQVAKRVAETLLCEDGPLDGIERLSASGNAAVLYRLAAIDAQLAADCIHRTFNDVSDPRTIDAGIRRQLVETLELIAFPAETFHDAALLLLRLAVAETEHGLANSSTRQFAALFPMLQGATVADGSSRIEFLREVANTNDSQQRSVVIKALLAGAKTMHFSRMVGAETHGSRPALKPWRPANAEEATTYVTFCVESLAREAKIDDDPGMAAKSGLGHELRALVLFGLTDVVERVVVEMRNETGRWPEAIESLGHSIQFDVAQDDQETITRLRSLIELLQPKTLSDRIRDLVSNMPWDYPNGEDIGFDEQAKRQLEAVHEVADDALENTDILREQLPQLCSGTQRWAGPFGEYVGERIDSPIDWISQIAKVQIQTPQNNRNFSFFSGFVKGLSHRDNEAVDAVKRHLAESPELAPALPSVCSRLGLVQSDIQLVIGALRSGVLTPNSLMEWTVGGALSPLPASSLAELFDELHRYDVEGLSVAIEHIGMWAHSSKEHLDDLRPQLIRLAESLVEVDIPRQGVMVAHHAKIIFKWLLGKGRDDSDARTLALTLARALTAKKAWRHTIDFLAPLLPDMLSNFPEITWPLIGQHIIQPTTTAMHLRNVMEKGSSFDRRDSASPILSLPPDTLFAWCTAQPEKAPACAARMLPILATKPSEEERPTINPLIMRLIDHFGDREDVLKAVSSNIHSFSWTGSLTTYYARFLGPLDNLATHPNPRVGRWARRMRLQLEREVKKAKAHDDEYQARFEV